MQRSPMTSQQHDCKADIYDDLVIRWKVWTKDNPHVWDLFQKFTWDGVGKGRKKFSAWLVVNRIRWETSIETTGEDFKIPNEFIALYARLWLKKHPDYPVFNTKKMNGETESRYRKAHQIDMVEYWSLPNR
jgi:hypothetical protein